jgi:hypothetical protein
MAAVHCVPDRPATANGQSAARRMTGNGRDRPVEGRYPKIFSLLLVHRDRGRTLCTGYRIASRVQVPVIGCGDSSVDLPTVRVLRGFEARFQLT